MKRLRVQSTIETQRASTDANARAPLKPLEWNFRGFPVQYLYAAPENATAETPAIVLVHGFGANCKQWRRNLSGLSEGGFRVYAIDLLGFGLGAKPLPGTEDNIGGQVEYTFDYWSLQLRDFVHGVVSANAQCAVHLVSNSIGCVACMQASVDDMKTCSSQTFISPSLRLLNVRKRSFLQGIFATILMRILSVQAVGAFFLSALAKSQQLRNVLLQAYKVTDAVDDELLDIISRPAGTPGALEVFLAFITYDEGPIPEDLLPEIKVPCQMLWGVQDDFEPISLGRSYADYDAVQQFTEIPGVGHCAHDEAPDIVNDHVLRFIAETTSDRNES